VQAIAGGVATVVVNTADGQTGTKQVLVSDLLPHYQASEKVNVPRSGGGISPGTITQLLADDKYFCVFLDQNTGKNSEKPVRGKALDQVN
jgi:hypothetical protein